MAQPTAPKTPEQYIASLDDPRRSEIEELHAFIRKTAPGLKPYIEGYEGSAMIGYGRYPTGTRPARKASGSWSGWPAGSSTSRCT